MRIICLLQNAWGGRNIPSVFKPNPLNKSAKVIKKMVGQNHVIHFCNTTKGSTRTAAECLPIDPEHCKSLTRSINNYDLLLVCGKQAEQAFNLHMRQAVNVRHLVVMHPASRTLSNVMCAEIFKQVNQ